MNIGQAIRYLRKKKGLTQQELAERAFTTKSNISNLENNNHGYSPTLLDYLAQALECKVSYIFFIAEQLLAQENNATEDNIPIELLFNKLPKETQQHLKALILSIIDIK